jgi:hypothetical protein
MYLVLSIIEQKIVHLALNNNDSLTDSETCPASSILTVNTKFQSENIMVLMVIFFFYSTNLEMQGILQNWER